MCLYCRVVSEVFVKVPLIPPWEDQCEWHRTTRMTGPDCAVMYNSKNTHTYTHTQNSDWEWTLLYPCFFSTKRLAPMQQENRCADDRQQKVLSAPIAAFLSRAQNSVLKPVTLPKESCGPAGGGDAIHLSPPPRDKGVTFTFR